MEKASTESAKKHTLTATARAHAVIGGVREVESFDEESVILLTDCGELTVTGEGLHIGTLDIARGTVEVTGQIDSVFYGEGKDTRRGFWSRLFG